MSDDVEVFVQWIDRTVTLHIAIRRSIGRPPPPGPAGSKAPQPPRPQESKRPIDELQEQHDVEVDQSRVLPPDIVYPIDELVLATRKQWLDFVKDATRGEEDAAVIEGVCLRPDRALLFERLDETSEKQAGGYLLKVH